MIRIRNWWVLAIDRFDCKVIEVTLNHTSESKLSNGVEWVCSVIILFTTIEVKVRTSFYYIVYLILLVVEELSNRIDLWFLPEIIVFVFKVLKEVFKLMHQTSRMITQIISRWINWLTCSDVLESICWLWT